MKTQKVRESQLSLKIKILSFTCFRKHSSSFTVRNLLIWCVLDIRDLESPFEFLERQHIIHMKHFRPTSNTNMRQELMKTHKFLLGTSLLKEFELPKATLAATTSVKKIQQILQ